MSSLIESTMEHSGALPEAVPLCFVAPLHACKVAKRDASLTRSSPARAPTSSTHLPSVHRYTAPPPTLLIMASVVATDFLARHAQRPTSSELCVL